MALLPAVSIAWYMTNHFPELMDGKHLDLWIIGAELIDGRDAGYWYQMLAPLTGLDHIKVRLIGPNVPEGADGDSIFRGSLEDLLAQDGLGGAFGDAADARETDGVVAAENVAKGVPPDHHGGEDFDTLGGVFRHLFVAPRPGDHAHGKIEGIDKRIIQIDADVGDGRQQDSE